VYSLLVRNLDEKEREKFDRDLFTPPEFRDALRRLNQRGVA
jgi:hypothetical protein